MADRVDYFFKQLVSEAELDLAPEGLEQADRAIVADLGFTGIVSGMGVTETAVPGLSVLVAAGAAYDAAGQRIRVPSAQTLSLAVDSNGVSTTVGNSGNSKVVSVFVQFSRSNQGPRSDGNSQQIYFKRLESFALVVRQGAEALDGAEVAPALEADKLLLADVKRTFGQTTIVNANVNPASYTARRQDMFVGGASPLGAYRLGKIQDVIAQLRAGLVETVITPAALLTGTSSDYNPTGLLTTKNVIVRQDLSAAASLRSIVAPPAALFGLRLKLYNISGTAGRTWTLNHEDGAATAANRIVCPNLANHVISPGGYSSVWYDGASNRWRVEAT